MHNKSSIVWLLSCAAMSCAGSHAEQVRDARMERIDARAEAKQERAERRADQREEKIAKSFDARAERVDEADRPTEDAQTALLDLARDRSEFRSQIQTRMETLATRINADQQKIEVLGDRAATPLRSELGSIGQQYQLLKQDVVQLDQAPDSSWGAKRSDIDRRAELLDGRVSALTDAIAEN